MYGCVLLSLVEKLHEEDKVKTEPVRERLTEIKREREGER